MVFIDGLEVLPGLAGSESGKIALLRKQASDQVQEIARQWFGIEAVPSASHVMVATATEFGIGPFVIPNVCQRMATAPAFAMEAPTTRENLVRILRACQLPKSILLEGSPGVGKTTLIQALANACGRNLCRINLSDQTDLIDLFGSDLPVVGGHAGEFAWQDAAFLTSMRNGDWVLLDEMNLASQAILEGLNAVLDHRGSVFIPELGRTFDKHPSFRIFAAQNPVHQGGGRKGLPKSFLNRFTKVYIQEHSRIDLEIICHRLFPLVSANVRNGIISFSGALAKSVTEDRLFGLDGRPWEFNLRDISRCLQIYREYLHLGENESLSAAVRDIFLSRFRSERDQHAASDIFASIFGFPMLDSSILQLKIDLDTIQSSTACLARAQGPCRERYQIMTPAQTRGPLDTLIQAVSQNWLAILVGSAGSGKRSLLRQLANLKGKNLSEYSMQPAVDTLEMLGSFEQSDQSRTFTIIVDEILDLVDRSLNATDTIPRLDEQNVTTLQAYVDRPANTDIGALIEAINTLLETFLSPLPVDKHQLLKNALVSAQEASQTSSFVWVDGPLVTAIKNGGWFMINDANLCNASVLDRLNSLCEPNGVLVLSERGSAEQDLQQIVPHPDFRLFLTFDPRNGELSRAMRNRGVEIAINVPWTVLALESTNQEAEITNVIQREYERSAQPEALILREVPRPDLIYLSTNRWELAARLARIFSAQAMSILPDSAAFVRLHTSLLSTGPAATALQTLPRWSASMLDLPVRLYSPQAMQLGKEQVRQNHEFPNI